MEAAATLVLDIQTKEALEKLGAVETALAAIGAKPVSVNATEAAAQLKTLNAEAAAAVGSVARVGAAAAEAAEGMLKLSISENKIGMGFALTAEQTGNLSARLGTLAEQAAALSAGGFDLSTMIKGQKLAQQETEGSIRSLSAYIKKLEEVDGIVKTLGQNGVSVPDTILKQYGVDATTLSEKLKLARFDLQVLQEQANQQSGNALNVTGTRAADLEKQVALEQQITAQMVAQADARALNVAGTQEAERAKALALEQQITTQMVAQAEARALNVAGTQEAERAKALALEQQITAQMVAQADARALNVAGTQEAERAKALALEQQITTQMVAQAEARALNVAGTQEAERAKALALEQQITAQMVAQAEARALNVAGTQEAERAKALALEQQITTQMVAQAEARALNVAGTQEAERAKALALEQQITAQMVAQADARALNVAGTQEAERAKALALEQQITTQMVAQAEARALNVAGTQEAERAKALALEQQITAQMVAQADARALNVAGTQEAERAKALALEQQITTQMVAQAEARALNVAGTQEAERAKALALEQQITAQMVAQADARALNVAGTQEAERAKALALEQQITTQMVAQAEARALNVAGTQEAERAKALALEQQITAQMVAQAEARALNVAGTQEAERAKALALEQQITTQMVAQAEARALNVAGTQEAERQKVLAAEKQITRELQLQREYILATDKQRVQSALEARKLMDASYAGNLAAQFAPQTLSTASSTSVSALNTQLKELESAQKAAAAATKTSGDHLTHWNKIANEAHAAARGLSGSLGGLWLTYGSIAPLLAAAAVAGSMKQVFTVGKDLEYQFTMISAISQGATVDLGKFNEAVKGTMFTPLEASKGLRVLAQAGLDVQDAVTALPAVLKLATVGETDMGTAALASAAIMHAFGLSVSDFGHIGDVFGKAAAISATSVTEMMAAMRQASSISEMYKVSLEEVGAALATLANRGIEGSAAGTSITNMVRELANPATQKAAEAMKRYGIETHNADGTSKSLTENLQQLARVTSTMSEGARTRWLGDMFNARSVKAVNILLSDLQKMEETTKELKASSEGLGFMTEASIKLSLSTEGALKTLKGDFQRTLDETFISVQPGIQAFIASLASAVNSTGFKEFLEASSRGIIGLTSALVDNIETVKLLAGAYIAFKGFTLLQAGITVLLPLLATAATGLATMGAALVANTAAMGLFAGTAVTLGTTLSGLVALIPPLALVTAAVAAIGYAAWKVYDALFNMTDAQSKSAEASKGYADANRTITTELNRGIEALDKDAIALAEQIRLMRMGKSEAEAYAAGLRKIPLALAEQNVQKAKTSYLDAQAGLNAVPKVNFGEGIPLLDPYAKERNGAKQLLEKTQGDLLSTQRDYSQAKIAAGVAADKAEANNSQRAFASQITAAKTQNERLLQIDKDGIAAAEALKKGGLNAQAAKSLQAQVDARKKAAAFKPVSSGEGGADVATPAETLRLKTQIDNLKDNSYQKASAAKGGTNAVQKTEALTNRANAAQLAYQTELQKGELNLLQSSHQAKLVSEEDYRDDLVAIYDKYDAKIRKGYEVEADRLKDIWTRSSGDEKLIAEIAYEKLKKTQADYLQSKELALKKSFDNEAKMTQEAWANTNKLIAEQVAATEEVKRKLEATRIKSTMTPEQGAYYDASSASKAKSDKNVADAQSKLESLRSAENPDTKQPVYAETSKEIQTQVEILEKLKSVREDLAAQAGEAAAAEAGYARLFSTGWTKAYKDASDAATDYGKMGEKVANGILDVFETFLFAPLDKGWKDALKAFGVMLQQMVAKAAAAEIMSKIMGTGTGSGGGSGGSIFTGLLGSIAGAVGGTGAQAGLANMLSGDPLDNLVSMLSAKGNVFSGPSGLGQFSNTVQTSPQTFAFSNVVPFAKGAAFKGSLAEKGPEAIMPLARDSAGRLGVRTQGAAQNNQVPSVVVNLYGNNNNAPDVRRAAGQGAREALAAFQGAQRYA